MTKRYELSGDAQWAGIGSAVTGESHGCRAYGEGQPAVCECVRSCGSSGAGPHWHDLPERYGKYKSVHKRFTRWAKSGVWEKICAVAA